MCFRSYSNPKFSIYAPRNRRDTCVFEVLLGRGPLASGLHGGKVLLYPSSSSVRVRYLGSVKWLTGFFFLCFYVLVGPRCAKASSATGSTVPVSKGSNVPGSKGFEGIHSF